MKIFWKSHESDVNRKLNGWIKILFKNHAIIILFAYIVLNLR